MTMIVAYEQIIYIFFLSEPIKLSWNCQSLQLHSEILQQFSILSTCFQHWPSTWGQFPSTWSSSITVKACRLYRVRNGAIKSVLTNAGSIKAHCRQEHTSVYRVTSQIQLKPSGSIKRNRNQQDWCSGQKYAFTQTTLGQQSGQLVPVNGTGGHGCCLKTTKRAKNNHQGNPIAKWGNAEKHWLSHQHCQIRQTFTRL